MDINIRKQISDGIEHRFLTKIAMDPNDFDNTIVDVAIPTYLADWNKFSNFRAYTISPTLAGMADTSALPFNKLIQISGIDMKKLQDNMRKVKKRKITLTSIGYGGLSINVFHFLSLLSYRVGVDEVFHELNIFDDDYLSFTNAIRFYKNLFKGKVGLGDRVKKIFLFDEHNLAETIVHHSNRFDEGSVEAMKKRKNNVFFGAPDFETRQLLEREQFLFAGHQGDGTILIKSPVVDTVATSETYGTINLTSFFVNMLVNAYGMMDVLANGFLEEEHDKILFQHNSKEHIKSKYELLRTIDTSRDIAVYKVEESLNIMV